MVEIKIHRALCDFGYFHHTFDYAGLSELSMFGAL